MDFSKLDLNENQEVARVIIERAAKRKFKNRSEFETFRNQIVKEKKGVIFDNLYFIKAYRDLLKEKKIKQNPNLLGLLRKRSVRTLSGVAPVTVLTKPYPCPGKCIYCPTDARMPKSYLVSQPAAQRAYLQKFDPYNQVFVRLKGLSMTGHEISKVELRIIGGTWSNYPKKYQIWFVKRCLQSMNEFSRKISGKKIAEKIVTFAEAEKENETALIRCIGINVETRPDFINEKEVKRMRFLGITKVEMGVQTTSENVQKITCRGHGLNAVKRATRLLKDAGFKIGYHMMPNLPGTSVELDKKMVGELFSDENFHPDYLKIYPCVVVPQARLSSLYRAGKYKPYDDKTLEEVLLAELKSVPEYCRVDRIARDIPSNEIEKGFKISNIRQILEEKLVKNGERIREIRFREIKNEKVDERNIVLKILKYKGSGGGEIFLSFECEKNDKLIALLRLRLPKKTFIKVLKNAAIVREVHVYGRQISVGEKVKGEKQHFGLGGRLMKEAEKLAKKAGYKKLAVISGIGTREYYKKLGYCLKGSYMVKILS